MNNRLLYIELLQAFGVILVILGHVFAPYIHVWYGYEFISSISVRKLHGWIYSFHMPLFFFLSGYLFEYRQGDNLKINRYIAKRFNRLVVPFIIFGVIFSVLIPLLTPTNITIKKTFVDFFCLRWNGHLWFLLSLFLSLSIYALFNNLYKNKVFSIILLLVFVYIDNLRINIVNRVIDNSLQNLLYVHIGAMCAMYRSDFKHLLFITIIIALLNIVIVDFSFMFMYTTIAISRILICFVISYMIAVVFLNFIKFSIVNSIAKNMFGIYLCSDFLIFIMRNILSEKINSNPIYSAVIILSFVIICSIFLIKLYKYMKIFLLNKCFVKKYA